MEAVNVHLTVQVRLGFRYLQLRREGVYIKKILCNYVCDYHWFITEIK